MTAISNDDLNSLAAKIDALDLTEAERAALDGVLERAEAYEPDVEGFGFNAAQYTSPSQSGVGLTATALKFGGGLGFITRPSLGYDETGGFGDSNRPGKPPPP